MQDHATDVVPRLGRAPGRVLAGRSHLHLLLCPLHAPWWAAYKDRSHSNDKKGFTVNNVFCNTTI